MFASRHIDLFGEVWQPVLIINNREVKRHVVGKKCIRHYAADRVFERCQCVAVPTTVPKYFVKGGDTKFYRCQHEPEYQQQWMLAGMRHDCAPTEHATIILSKNCRPLQKILG